MSRTHASGFRKAAAGSAGEDVGLRRRIELLRSGHSRTLLARATPTWSETWESNPARPVPKTGGPPWTMSLVPRARIERASPRFQRGAVTRSAVEGYRVRVSIPSGRFERATTSPEVERGMTADNFFGPVCEGWSHRQESNLTHSLTGRGLRRGATVARASGLTSNRDLVFQCQAYGTSFL